ncbi:MULTISPECIES: hypothetical protein [unclassified Kribbella]|uniref:hypothetical protein n=1 Tax=unclassified Kribbella TaxID=2644121 RepID=UPI0030166784
MRAKFVVLINAVSISAYPTDEALVDRLLTLGLGRTSKDSGPYEDRRKAYLREAEREWDHLPEVAVGERDHVIFFARLPDHCRLIVTRSLQGYATFRLIHDNLGELEKNAEHIVGELTKKVGAIEGLQIESNRVEVYEHGRDHVILIGRAIDSPLREAVRNSPADLVCAAVTGVASLVTVALLAFAHLTPDSLARGSVERFSTAMIAAFFIAVVSFVQRWWQAIRQGGVEWHPAYQKRRNGG